MNKRGLLKTWTVSLKGPNWQGGSWSLQSLQKNNLTTELEFIQSAKKDTWVGGEWKGVFLKTIQQPEERVICHSDANTVQGARR